MQLYENIYESVQDSISLKFWNFLFHFEKTFCSPFVFLLRNFNSYHQPSEFLQSLWTSIFRWMTIFKWSKIQWICQQWWHASMHTITIHAHIILKILTWLLITVWSTTLIETNMINYYVIERVNWEMSLTNL